MALDGILKVCPGATPENMHTLIEVTPDSNKWFCRNDKCKIAYLKIDKFGKEEITWMGPNGNH